MVTFQVFKWVPTPVRGEAGEQAGSFVEHQALPTHAAMDMEPFTMAMGSANDDTTDPRPDSPDNLEGLDRPGPASTFLAVANQYDGVSYNTQSMLYVHLKKSSTRSSKNTIECGQLS